MQYKGDRCLQNGGKMLKSDLLFAQSAENFEVTSPDYRGVSTPPPPRAYKGDFYARYWRNLLKFHLLRGTGLLPPKRAQEAGVVTFHPHTPLKGESKIIKNAARNVFFINLYSNYMLYCHYNDMKNFKFCRVLFNKTFAKISYITNVFSFHFIPERIKM